MRVPPPSMHQSEPCGAAHEKLPVFVCVCRILVDSHFFTCLFYCTLTSVGTSTTLPHFRTADTDCCTFLPSQRRKDNPPCRRSIAAKLIYCARCTSGSGEARGQPGITSLREIYTVGLHALLLNMPLTLRDVKENSNVEDAPRL